MAVEAEDELPPEGAEAEALAPDQDEAEDQAPEAEAEAPPSVEDLARDLGWKPETEWKGPKDNWTPAADYLRHKVSKADRVADEIKSVKDTLNRVSRTTAAITERAIAEERAALEQRFAEATEAGDTQAAWQAAQDIQRHQNTAVEPADDPLTEFRERNGWYGDDAEATAYAASLGELHKGKPIEEQIRLVEAAVKKRFPEHFEAESREQTPARRPQGRTPLVSATQSRAARPAPRSKTEADLPLEARKAGEDFVRRGRVSSLADYAKIYFEENA